MASTTLSEKFQIVIPKEIRESLGLKAGDKLAVWKERDRIEITPFKKIKNPIAFLGSLSAKKHRLSIKQLEKDIETGAAK